MSDGFFSSAAARAVRPLPTLVANCGRCGLAASPNCRSPKMRVDGEGRRGIMVVSDYPGKDEDAAGRPLVGGAGRFLAAELSALGVDLRRDCWLTNAQICYDADKRGPKTATEDCRPNLLRAVAAHDPRVILLLGGVAVHSLLSHLWKADVGKPARWWGIRIPAQKPNVWVCPSYNPAHVARDGRDGDRNAPLVRDAFRAHLAAAVALPGRPWDPAPPDYVARVEVVADPAAAAASLRRITAGTVAWDIETTTLKPDGPHAEIVCCSVCWEGRETFAFPWHGAAVPAMLDLLQNPDVGKVGFNTKFETRWIKRLYDVDVRGWVWDGMLAAHLLDPRRGVTGLKYQAFVRLGQPDYNSHVAPFLDSGKEAGGNAPNRIWEIDLHNVLRYCGLDSLLEYEVAQVQMREMGL